MSEFESKQVEFILPEERPLRYSFWAGALAIRGSVTLRVALDVLVFGLLTIVIVLGTREIERRLNVVLNVPVAPFEAVGAVLGVLLVLRTNAGYDRWWEARKLWGGIVNQSRNLAVIALTHGPAELAWRSRVVRWIAALPYAIRDQLRSRHELPEIRRLLGESRADRISEAGHMPSIVVTEIDQLLRVALEQGMHPMAFNQAQHERILLVDHLGGCERILKTPLARSSAIQVRRFVLLFLITLPLPLLEKFNFLPWGYMLVPIFIMLTAYPLLSLDRIGMELQNPFDPRRVDHLPLDSICTTIERNLLELLENSVRDEGVDLPDANRKQKRMEESPHDTQNTFIS